LDPDHISELFAAFGRVDVRTMFGGAGIYADGLMFGLVVDDVIYLKADAHTAPRFEREGCGPFTYRHQTRGTLAEKLLAHAGPALRRAGGAGGLGQGRARSGPPRRRTGA